MQYLLLIYEDEKRWATMSEAATSAEVGEYHTFGKQFANAIKGGNALQPTSTATTVRVRNGKRLTSDGMIKAKEASWEWKNENVLEGVNGES